MRTRKSKLFGAVLCVIGLVLTMISGILPASADESTVGSIKLICTNQETAIADLNWKLFKIGERTPYGEFVLTGDFAEYPVSLEDISDSEIKAAADTLESYTVADSIPALAEKTTDENGIADFESLDLGLYLITGEPVTIGETIYTPSPSIIEVRDIDADVAAYPKFSLEDVPQDETMAFKVSKVWLNTEDVAIPENIDVEIYLDKELFEEVTLSADTDWTFEMNDLPVGSYTVIEKNIPENYTVAYLMTKHMDSVEFIIENTYDTPDDSSEIDSSSEITSGGDSSEVVTSSSNPGTPPPQTGQLWWPVPVLAVLGLVFIVFGFRLFSKKEND